MNKTIGVIVVLVVILLGAGLLYSRGGWPGGGSQVAPPISQQAESDRPSVLAEVPSSLPQDLLAEPIAPTLIQTRNLNKTTEEIKIEYVSLNAAAQVVKLYQQILTAKGWNVEVVSQDSMRAQLKVTKDKQAASFSLAQTPTSGTQVTLIYTHPIK